VVRRVTVVGLASGQFKTVQQLASSIGLAVLASLAATQTEALISSGHSTRKPRARDEIFAVQPRPSGRTIGHRVTRWRSTAEGSQRLLADHTLWTCS
jgi:hypothetical protein